MATLKVLCSNPHNVLKEVTKKVTKVHKKILKIFHGSSIFALNVSWPLQKLCGLPFYILNVRSLRDTIQKISILIHCQE